MFDGGSLDSLRMFDSSSDGADDEADGGSSDSDNDDDDDDDGDDDDGDHDEGDDVCPLLFMGLESGAPLLMGLNISETQKATTSVFSLLPAPGPLTRQGGSCCLGLARPRSPHQAGRVLLFGRSSEKLVLLVPRQRLSSLHFPAGLKHCILSSLFQTGGHVNFFLYSTT